MKTQTVWLDGPPPHVGWWNASLNREADNWRWWDGNVWSFPAFPTSNMRWVVDAARMRSHSKEAVQRTHYYPANARVPRVAPAKPTEPTTTKQHADCTVKKRSDEANSLMAKLRRGSERK